MDFKMVILILCTFSLNNKYLKIKIGLIRFSLIIYLGAGRMEIYHLELLKLVLLEVFIRNLTLKFQKPVKARKPS